VDPSWLYVLFRLKKFSADDHKPVMVYEVLIPHLLQSPIEPRARASLKGPYAKYAVPETLQRAGVCYYRCILCAMRYALRRLGLSQNHVKQLRVTMRRGYLLCVKRGLNRILQVVSSSKTTPDLPGLYPSQRRLVRLASKQVAYVPMLERFSLSLSLFLSRLFIYIYMYIYFAHKHTYSLTQLTPTPQVRIGKRKSKRKNESRRAANSCE